LSRSFEEDTLAIANDLPYGDEIWCADAAHARALASRLRAGHVRDQRRAARQAGAGLDLARMCDIRIASEKAKFAESFVRLGIIPGDGRAWLLPRIVGLSRAVELAFTGDTIDAQQALAWNLVSRVVSHDELMTATRELAGRITRNAAHGLRPEAARLVPAYSSDRIPWPVAGPSTLATVSNFIFCPFSLFGRVQRPTIFCRASG
jgi:hypothetical protein